MNEIDPERLQAETMVRSVRWLQETGSTNSDALVLPIESETDLPLLLGADRQTSGRGRGSNRWWSTAGGLTFSLLLNPTSLNIEVRHWPRVSLAVGIAVARLIDDLFQGPTARLKWPNDVFIQDRKVCGILVESAGVRLERLVIGIGLNVNNSFRESPAELQAVMTSLSDLAQRDLDRTDILIGLLRRLESELSALSDPQRSRHQLETFREYCLLTGRIVTVSDPSMEQTGLCLGIDDDGALSMQTESGRIRCLSGTVRLAEIDDTEAK